MIIIPIGHDRQVTKRLPVITITLIAFNILVFIYTATVGAQQSARKEVTLKSLIEFSSAHPEVQLSEQAKDRLSRVADLEIEYIQHSLEAYKLMREMDGQPTENQVLSLSDRSVLEAEGLRLSKAFVAAFDDFYGYNYGFVPAYHKGSLLNYFSCMFLHGGFLHILGNMLFLFLAGIAMEDAWGRGFYTAFYLAAGVVATATHAFTSPESKIYLVGASGAIAGLMGAFMVRYFKARIKFFYYIFFRFGTFKAPAYVMLPLWIALELKDTFTTSESDTGGVAFWAHIGGFFFGAVGGALVHFSGLGKWLMPKKVGRASSFGTGNAIHEAVAHMQEGEHDEAIRKLRQRLEAVPGDEKACLALAKIQGELGQRQSEVSAYVRLIRILMQKGKLNEAIQAYSALLETYQANEPPLRLPMRDWMLLCEHLVERGMPHQAAGEFEKLGLAYPGEPLANEALVNAAELRMRLNEHEYAANIFAYVKTQPGIDSNLYMRIAECEAQLSNMMRGRNAA